MNPVSLMANASKLSVGQLQQAIKNGTVPAYIGIPMMQEKMKQAKQAQTPPAPKEPPIAQQVMAEAAGIDQVPSNLPTQAMNDGGIVSFADGGDVEDFDQEEYEDQLAEQEYAQAIEERLNAAEQGGGRLSAASNTAANTAPVVSSANINSTPNVEGGIRGVVNEAANKYGLPPELLQRISGSESGHNPRAKNSASSAEGLFQFIPSTWAGMGGKPGEQSDPVKNADLGGKFIRQNAETLKRQLGRNPNYDEVYAAHYFGPGVTAMLKNATPDMPIEQGLRMFNSEKFVPIIMQQNPNLRGKTVGQVMGSLRQKMGDGQVSLAEGGIARLNNGGLPRFNGEYGSLTGEEREKYLAGLSYKEPDTSSPAGRFFDRFVSTPKNLKQKEYETNRQNALRDQARVQEQFGSNAGMSGLFKTQTPKEYENAQIALDRAREGVLSAQRGSGYKPPDIHGNYKPEVRDLQTPVQGGMSPEYEPSVLGGMGMSPEYEPSTKVPAGNTGNTNTSSDSGAGGSSGGNSNGGSGSGSSGGKQKSEYDLIREDIMNQREELKRQKQEDKYMAILQAGLGMMGGTSPNAFANIGQGASAGIAQYSQSGKQRAAENAALNKGLITAQRYKGMDDYQRAALASRESYQDRMLGDKSEANTERKELKQAELDARIDKNLADAITNNAAKIDLALQKKYGEVSLMGTKERAAFEAERADRYNKEVNHYIQIQNNRLQQRYPDIFKDSSSVRPAPTGSNIIRYDAKGNVIN